MIRKKPDFYSMQAGIKIEAPVSFPLVEGREGAIAFAFDALKVSVIIKPSVKEEVNFIGSSDSKKGESALFAEATLLNALEIYNKHLDYKQSFSLTCEIPRMLNFTAEVRAALLAAAISGVNSIHKKPLEDHELIPLISVSRDNAHSEVHPLASATSLQGGVRFLRDPYLGETHRIYIPSGLQCAVSLDADSLLSPGSIHPERKNAAIAGLILGFMQSDFRLIEHCLFNLGSTAAHDSLYSPGLLGMIQIPGKGKFALCNQQSASAAICQHWNQKMVREKKSGYALESSINQTGYQIC